jgi:alpha-tubulin suppressor-like RCC1 family protein
MEATAFRLQEGLAMETNELTKQTIYHVLVLSASLPENEVLNAANQLWAYYHNKQEANPTFRHMRDSFNDARNDYVILVNDDVVNEPIRWLSSKTGMATDDILALSHTNLFMIKGAFGQAPESYNYTACCFFFQTKDVSSNMPDLLLSMKIMRQSQYYIAAGAAHTVGLKRDGTVVAVGHNSDGKCEVGSWRDITAVAASHHTVGLRADGTVVACGCGSDTFGKGRVSGWQGIVAIATGENHTVGLRTDGTVIAAGKYDKGQCDTNNWQDIIAVAAGQSHTVGLKTDGTVVAVGEGFWEQCDVGSWEDISAVSAKDRYTVGLKGDGTVVAVGKMPIASGDISHWQNIVAVSAGENHLVGLKENGTIIAVGDNEYGQCDTGGWEDVVAISAGSNTTVGLKRDGAVVAVGSNDCGQCEASRWRDIGLVSSE